MKKRMLAFVTALLLLCACVPAFAQETQTITVLFTHDMHSHLTAFPYGDETRGGFARLKTLIDAERAQDEELLLVDAGDFSMGTLYQAGYETDAAELTMMAQLGFDATTFGNHEFDYQGMGAANMLRAAMKNAAAEGTALPTLLCSNIDWTNLLSPDGEELHSAMQEYGMQQNMIMESNGVKVGIFGMMGQDSISCAPLAPVGFIPLVECAKEQVAALQGQGAELIICISHSGIWDEDERSEDELLAKAVPEIDLIVSGHTHSTLEAPITHGSTYIVSCGEYTLNLGKIVLERSGADWSVAQYELIPTGDDVAADARMDETAAEYRARVSENYLSHFGYTYDQVLCRNNGGLTAERSLLADAVMAAVQEAEGENYAPVAMAIVPSGVIRTELPLGDVTTADAFNVLSLGIGPDRLAGYPLVSAYLTGRELYDLAEVDASVSGLMTGTKLYPAGGGWEYKTDRLILSRTCDVWVYGENGEKLPVEEDKLYRIIADLYSTQMLGTVKEKSFGLLSLVPKDANGVPITDFTEHIVRDGEGNEVKEWVALADYLYAFGGGDGSGAIPEMYAQDTGRIVKSTVQGLGDHFSHPGRIMYVLLGALAAVVLLVVLIIFGVRAVVRRIRRSRK